MRSFVSSISSFTSRPVLLALTVLLVVGAIVLVESRFGAASSGQPTGSSNSAAPDPGQTPAPAEPGSGNSPDSPAPQKPGDEEAQRLAEKASEYPRAEEITSPTGFINTEGVSIQESRGEEVILLDFWTYSCINCQNTQPYLNAWHDRYADDGLRVIGVHKPEFEFEKNPANVEAAVRQAGIEYPVVLDNDDGTWDAYDQNYWPTMYLIDTDGFVRYKHIGEGAYEETEAEIRKLLAEKDDAAGP